MDKITILSEIQSIMRNVLDAENIVLTETTTADDVKGWDSLGHIQLVVSIEKRFNIKFSAYEMLSWRNVGQMVETISSKTVS